LEEREFLGAAEEEVHQQGSPFRKSD